ncbi:MAG: deoxyribodipyrimidine photo-lyase [Rhodospirillales bacterium]
MQPGKPNWAGGLRETWTPGEASAHARLVAFVEEEIGEYHLRRDRPEPSATSMLSPHLHFGELSPRQVWHAVAARIEADSRRAAGGRRWLQEIGWREFCAHLTAANPQIADAPLQPRFAAFPWSDDAAALRAWQRGLTGYPIVDAGMRQLWRTGWMHNRVRLLVASFLVKHLLIPWQQGEAWFWDTLVDADLGNNAGGWQWVAGCGIDAAPYFRIFNPVLQGEKFDSKGDYVRRWVPELARLPARLIHQPWQATPAELAAAGVRLGTDYPTPLIEHKAARARAMAAFSGLAARG